MVQIKIKSRISLWLVFFLSISMSSCSKDDSMEDIQPPTFPNTPSGDVSKEEPNEENDKTMDTRICITIGSTSYDVEIENNATATAIKEMLPFSIQMNELNGNEKYANLTKNLPTAPYNPGTIYTGDLMLYGSSCLVLFYQTFTTSYNYTKIGKIQNPQGLSATVGSGAVTITFENTKQ